MFSFFTSRANRAMLIKGIAISLLSVYFPSISMATPSEARLSALEKCHSLGKVEGWSGYGKNSSWQTLAKSYALAQAEKLGASHVVWERMIPVGVYNGYAVASVYSCS